MRKVLTAIAVAIAAPALVSAPAMAQYHHDRQDDHHDRQDDRNDYHRNGYNGGNHDRGNYQWQGDRNGGWDPSSHYDGRGRDERRLGRNDRVYRGGDGRYYCRRGDGTTGLVIGGLAGGVLGNVVGGGTLGTLLGAGGGALLGRSVDRGNVRCR